MDGPAAKSASHLTANRLTATRLGASDPTGSHLSVVCPLWQDRPPAENLAVARRADLLGYRELWIGEMATYDAFALGTAVGLQTERIRLSLGPFAVAVRTPVTVAMGAASVQDLIGRDVGVALGTSSDVVVSRWHGRDRSRPAAALEDHAILTRSLMDGERGDHAGAAISAQGYHLRLPELAGPLSIAAFGPRALTIAAVRGDRLLLNMLSVDLAAKLIAEYRRAAVECGNQTPRVAIWLATAVDPSPATLAQIARGKVPYLGAPGYGEMFVAAGFGDLVDRARSGTHPKQLLASITPDVLEAVGLIGSVGQIASRIAEYRGAGVDDICVVPATADDDGGTRTLTALAS